MAEEIYPPDPRRASGDLILEADYDRDGVGRFSIRTAGVERLAVEADGSGRGLVGGARYDPRLQQVGTSIKRALVAVNESFGLAWLTDSTGNDQPAGGNSGDWPYELGALIAASYPAYTVKWYLWDDTSQDYVAPVTIQTGTGGERYVNFTGATFAMFLPPSVIATPPTDLDVSVKVAMDDWTPAALQVLASRFGTAGNRSWYFYVDTNGKLTLQWSNDGTALLSAASTVAPTVADGATLWVRVTLDVDNGAVGNDVKFYTSANGATWTQLGTTITTAGVTALFNASTTNYEIGGRTDNVGLLAGKMYEIRLRSGINGGTIAPCFPEQWQAISSASPQVATGAPVLALVVGAMPGQGLTYLTNATRLPLLLPDYTLRAVFMATSHNDGTSYGRDWETTWTNWITSVRGQAYFATPVLTTQNPEKTGTSSTVQGIVNHERRREKLLAIASLTGGVASYDAYQAFLDTGEPNTYINADGIHPLLTTPTGKQASGAQVWANDTYAALFRSVS